MWTLVRAGMEVHSFFWELTEGQELHLKQEKLGRFSETPTKGVPYELRTSFYALLLKVHNISPILTFSGP